MPLRVCYVSWVGFEAKTRRRIAEDPSKECATIQDAASAKTQLGMAWHPAEIVIVRVSEEEVVVVLLGGQKRWARATMALSSSTMGVTDTG